MKKNHTDRLLLVAVILLLTLGILMVYSASSVRGAEKFNDPAKFLKLHLFRVALGLFFMLIAFKIDYCLLRWVTPFFLFGLFALLIIVLFMPTLQDTHRWFLIKGNRFQPSEFMKLTMIFYLSAIFAKGTKSNAIEGKPLYVHYFIVLMTIFLVFIEPDLGSSLVLFFIAFSLFFMAGVALKNLALMGAFMFPIVMLGMTVFPYQKKRITDFLGSVSSMENLTYQVKQSVIGLSHGGFSGTGYGAGKQKLYFLPEPFSDFVLASLGEELGFIGILLVFILLSIVLWRGIRIALSAPDYYGFLMAGGITSMILLNALVNAGVVVNLLPTTGLPFPFLSYGGSSLFVQMIGVGILLNIAKKASLSKREVAARIDQWAEFRR